MDYIYLKGEIVEGETLATWSLIGRWMSNIYKMVSKWQSKILELQAEQIESNERAICKFPQTDSSQIVHIVHK